MREEFFIYVIRKYIGKMTHDLYVKLYDLDCAQTTIFKFSKFNFTLLRFMTGLYSFMMREVNCKKIETDAKTQFFYFV